MSDEEHALLKQKIKEAGLDQQTVILNAIAGHKTTSAEEVVELKESNKQFADAISQLRSIVSNLREEIVKGISGKFEKYGFDKEGKSIIDKPLSEYDELIKSNMLALFEARNINSSEKFIECWIQFRKRW